MNEITRPALRYHGGKWVAAPWILSHFPVHESYIEPFAGAASVLLRKPPSPIEVYNDLDGEVVNFFEVLRTRPDELVRVLELTPFSRAELARCLELATDPLERARRTFVRSWQGRSRRILHAAGWRYQRQTWSRSWTPPHDFAALERLYDVAERFRLVHIECSPALEVIARFDQPRALFYCDPPYVASTRSERWEQAYHTELTDDDHRELAEVLRGIQGMAVVSGYPSELYDEVFEGWPRFQRRSATDHRGEARFRTECLWLSPNAAAAARQGTLALGEVG